MEMSLFKKDGKIFTRFKVRLKEFSSWVVMLKAYGIKISEPSKKSSRYIYFEKEGDWINGKM